MNEIIFRLCDEDRNRLDRIIEGLEALKTRPNFSECVGAVADTMDKACARLQTNAEGEDPLQKKLADTLAKAEPAETAKNAAGASKAETQADVPPTEEKPEAAKPATSATEKKVTLADIQQKVIKLSAEGKKAQVRVVILGYAEKVTALPPESFAEVYEKLTALEG